jgi:hypothetical protein
MTNMTPSPELVERLRRKLGKPNNLAILCDEAADEIERLRATHLEEVVRLRPIETAPRDGTPVFVQFRSDIYPDLRPQREDLEAWNGVSAVMRNRGDISDWCFAAPVGHGGFPDEWLVGWAPVSIAKGVAALTLFEVRR